MGTEANKGIRNLSMLNLFFRALFFAGVTLFTLALFVGCAETQTYIVQPGDSLPDIAVKHELALSDLIRANQDRYPSLAADPENPPVGIELLIPNEGGTGIDKWFARLAAAASAPVTPAPDVPAAPNEKINAVVQLIQRGINQERALNKLPVLAFDPRLADIAQARSNDMIRRAYFSHDDPERGSVAFQDLIRSKQFQFSYAGENIAEIKNQGTLVPSALTVYSRYGATEIADQFVTGWVNSQEHRDNILNPHFAKTGIALGVSIDGTRIVATQIFSD